MKKIMLCALVCVLAMLIASCEITVPAGIRTKKLTGDPVTETIPMTVSESGVSLRVSLSFADPDSAHITVLPVPEGENPHAVVTYPADLADEGFVCREENGELYVGIETGVRYKTDRFALTVYAPVTEYRLSGSVEISGDMGNYPAETLLIGVSGAAECEIANIAVKNTEISIEGAADIGLSGKTETLGITVEGAGEVEAEDLSANSCRVKIAGAGSAAVRAEKTLDVLIEGAGSVTYKGDPIVTKDIRGLGSVARDD